MFDHISSLLYWTDKVIVPGLGTFTGTPVPAKIEDNGQEIRPPYKKLHFISGNPSNDGVLATHVAKSEHISYAEALKKIQSFSENVKKKLESRQSVIFPQLGKLKADRNNQIVFLPDNTINYLPESYGLAPIFGSRLEKPIKKEADKPANTERKPLNKPAVEKGEPTGSSEAWMIPIVSILALGLVLTSLWFLYPPFQKKIRDLFVRKEIAKEIPPPIKEKPAESPVRKALITSETPDNAKFFVVAGAFQDFENASIAVSDLKKRGYDARFLGEKKGRHLVGYCGFDNKPDAIRALRIIQREENEGAWLFRK